MQYGQRPNELVVKKLSMLGCVALVLAHSVKDMQDKLRGYHTGRRSFCFRSARLHTQWNFVCQDDGLFCHRCVRLRMTTARLRGIRAP